jgi:arsenate reductase
MAEAFLQSFDKELEVFSAGIEPGQEINPYAVRVMNELKLDISQKKPRHYSEFLNTAFDYLITVCDGTREEIKIPPLKFNTKFHLGFADPQKFTGTEEETLHEYRRIRDEIKNEIDYFYYRILKHEPVPKKNPD